MSRSGGSAALVTERRQDRRHLNHRLVRAAIADERVAFGCIIVLGLAVRLVAISQRLNVDDGYSWLVGSAPSSHAFLHQLAASENTPPLFYLLLTPLPLGQPAWLRVPAAIPGVLMCVVLYFALRRPLGVRVALIAALAVAVAPLLVTYSDLSRGFMLEDLALVVALWAVLKLSDGESLAWWAVYLVAAVVAVYSEYDAAIFLVALTAAALWIGTPIRRRMAILGPLPLLALAPWIPQILRAQDAVNKTKIAPTFPAPSLTVLREVTVTLALGEYGGVRNPAVRWIEFGLLVALMVLALIVLRRTAGPRDGPGRRAITLIAGTGALTLIGHAIAGALGVDVFNQRYLTIMIVLMAALGAAAIVSTERRLLIVAASILLAALGLANLAKRYHHQWNQDLTPIRLAAIRLHPRTVLTDNPVVLYYLGSLRPQLDRPFNLGSGRAQTCARPCLIIDDLTVVTGTPRVLTGSTTTIGHYALTLER